MTYAMDALDRIASSGAGISAASLTHIALIVCGVGAGTRARGGDAQAAHAMSERRHAGGQPGPTGSVSLGAS